MKINIKILADKISVSFSTERLSLIEFLRFMKPDFFFHLQKTYRTTERRYLVQLWGTILDCQWLHHVSRIRGCLQRTTVGYPRNVTTCLKGMTSEETKAMMHQQMTIDLVISLVMPRDESNRESIAIEGYPHANKVINNNFCLQWNSSTIYNQNLISFSKRINLNQPFQTLNDKPMNTKPGTHDYRGLEMSECTIVFHTYLLSNFETFTFPHVSKSSSKISSRTSLTYVWNALPFCLRVELPFWFVLLSVRFGLFPNSKSNSFTFSESSVNDSLNDSCEESGRADRRCADAIAWLSSLVQFDSPTAKIGLAGRSEHNGLRGPDRGVSLRCLFTPLESRGTTKSEVSFRVKKFGVDLLFKVTSLLASEKNEEC